MTNEQRSEILLLREQGFGYKKLANETGISVNTIKSFLRNRRRIEDDGCRCLNCGVMVIQTPHKKKRKFCSDNCRNAWWSSHPEMRKDKPYIHTCIYCGKDYPSDRRVSKYCSVSCFADARRGVPLK